MKAIYTLHILFVLLSGLSFCSAQPANTNLSNALSFHGEPYIAVNPANHQNIVACWMGLKYTGSSFKIAVTVRSSFDGGNTWNTAVTLPHHLSTYTSADVSLAFDKHGLLYLSYIDNDQVANGGDYISRSFNGGLTWDTATEVIGISEAPGKKPLDRPWLVVDNSNTANFGTLYVTTKPAPTVAPPNRSYYKVSTDSGHTWSTLANVDGGNYLVGNQIAAPMAAPATTINGHFCAVYPSYVASQNPLPTFYPATSKDQGHTFSYSHVISQQPATLDTNLKGGYHLAASPVDSNKMSLVAVDSYLGEADIVSLHSEDGGQTWSNRIRVNDDAVGNGKDQDMVWSNYNEQGNLVVTWRDRRNSTTNGFWNAGYDFYYATSGDNGQTFSANKLLSSQFITFDSIIAQNGNDFMSCAYQQDTLYTVWGDTRNGHMNIYFAKTIASIDSTVGITLLQGESARWSVYPNPVSTHLNIELSDELVGKQISVFDASGKIVTVNTIPSMHFNIPTNKWAPGSYYLKVGEDIKRVIKQ